jgi:hypothetical protein
MRFHPITHDLSSTELQRRFSTFAELDGAHRPGEREARSTLEPRYPEQSAESSFAGKSSIVVGSSIVVRRHLNRSATQITRKRATAQARGRAAAKSRVRW